MDKTGLHWKRMPDQSYIRKDYSGLMGGSRGRDAHGADRRGAQFPKAECCQRRYQAHRVTPGPLPLHTHTHTHTHPSGASEIPISPV